MHNPFTYRLHVFHAFLILSCATSIRLIVALPFSMVQSSTTLSEARLADHDDLHVPAYVSDPQEPMYYSDHSSSPTPSDLYYGITAHLSFDLDRRNCTGKTVGRLFLQGRPEYDEQHNYEHGNVISVVPKPTCLHFDIAFPGRNCWLVIDDQKKSRRFKKPYARGSLWIPGGFRSMKVICKEEVEEKGLKAWIPKIKNIGKKLFHREM
ncbi:hypothetical protein FB446DRAFT_848051 [Lentinula raphanica]|nr:hypothetical protein C8R42DRAFT_651091 [Lentinula raphanica]KAJ3769000.1 hypothetical protein FB446DRAFT_848051 [Lentinula raphanica]